MSKFIKGQDRSQGTLFPERLDDYVEEDNPVRVIDVFIEDLDISGLGFKAEPAATGRPGYHPKMKRRLRGVESAIERYLAQLDATDQSEPAPDDAKTLQEKVAKLREEMARLKKLEVRMLEAPDQQLSLTDPDARSMNSRGSGVVGYNVQSAVDARHHLIVAHDVSTVGSDRQQLSKMAKQAKAILGTEKLTVVADKGYYNGDELRECQQNNIVAYVAKPKTSPNKVKGQFDRSGFKYVREDDEYECPAGERLIFRNQREESGKQIRRYWSSACGRCSIKSQCTRPGPTEGS